MTFGEKIKYCRNRLGITQAKLVELSGISLVSIKRYENDKMTPTQPHLESLSKALGISALAFTDTYFESLHELETYGDLIRLLMIFRKNHIVTISGDRGEDGKLISETVTFSPVPIIGKMFQTANDKLSGENILLTLKSKIILDNLLKWESVYTKYEASSEKYKGDEGAKAILKEIEDNLDVIELEMQFNNLLLERVNGHIAVKISPYLENEPKTPRKNKKPKKNSDE